MNAAVVRMTHGAGSELHEARMKRRWTLQDVAYRAGVSVASVQAAESGRTVSLETYARLAVALGRRPVLAFEARSDRAVSRLVHEHDLVHAAMGEAEARQLAGHGHTLALDEPYQHYQFAGRADLLAWSLDARALLHIENKSRLSDVQDLAGSYNAKRQYLASVLADRLGLAPIGWRTVTHVLVVLWSAEVLHVLRRRQATFAALCPSPIDAFAAWWNGGLPEPGVRSAFVLFDPEPDLAPRKARFVGADRVGTVDPRYRDYADAAAALQRISRP